MKIQELIDALTNIKADKGNIDVLFEDPNNHYGPYSVESVTVDAADKDEYPDDFGMPEGFTFVLLTNL
jgi:hypothetical protein